MRGDPSPYRLALSVVNLFAAATIIVALTVQIADRVANGEFNAEHYFSYFTIQSSLGNIVVLVAAGVYGLQSPRDTPLLSGVRAHFVAYSLITATIYNVVLRDLPARDGVWVSPVQWPNEITHVWIPAYFLLDWILNPHRPRLPSWTLPLGCAFPLAWLSFTLVHGGLTGWYPYDFMDPTRDAGWLGVAVYAGGIGVTIIVILAATALVNIIHDTIRPKRLLKR